MSLVAAASTSAWFGKTWVLGIAGPGPKDGQSELLLSPVNTPSCVAPANQP